MGEKKTYHFRVNGGHGVFYVSFVTGGDVIESSCNCKLPVINNLCWHRECVLAEKKEKIPSYQHAELDTFIHQLSKTSTGRKLIHKAKVILGEEEICRRCGSTDIIDLKTSRIGRLLSFFVSSGRQYFCWHCRWSW